MSLDIWLTATIETEVAEKNITHNLSGMWRQAGVYSALYESEGLRAKDVLPVLEEGLRLMQAQPQRFKVYDSPNGWGTYKNAVPWLSDLIVEFKKYPEGIIGVSS